jgi:iron complex transport system substrate-binding protein
MTELRILPLISSATEIVHALGLGAFQVGRSHECDYPAEVLNLPVCTRPAIAVSGSSAEIDALVKERLRAALSVYEVDASLIRSLRPTHIITQTQCKVCAVSLDDVQNALRDECAVDAQIVSCEPYSLADVWKDIERIASACGEAERGDRLVADLKMRMAALKPPTDQRPTVAALEWLEPLMAAAYWIPELIEIAGGRAVTLADEPDVIVAHPCGFDLQRTRAEMKGKGLTGRVYICDGNQFMNRPGPRLVESAEIFAQILHPEHFAATLRGVGWEEFPNRIGNLAAVEAAVLDKNFVGVRTGNDDAG